MKLKALRCPECGAKLEINNDREFCFCSYCGCKIIIDDEKQETTINKNINITKSITHTQKYVDEAEIVKAKSMDKEDKRGWIALIICAVLAICIPLGMSAKYDIEEKIAKKEGKVSVGYYQDLEGQDYESVVAHFESAGFDNIELIDLNDSGILFWNEGKVEQVSVAGNNSFDSSDYFSTDAKVVISYH